MHTIDRATPSVDAVARALREADSLVASAVSMISQLSHSNGMPTEWILRLIGRRTHWEASELTAVAETLGHMPRTADLLEAGVVSMSQIRAAVRAVKHLPVDSRAQVDKLIASCAHDLVTAEPEELVSRVDDLVAKLRADLTLRREDARVERSFLMLQPRLHGGGMLYGEADTESFATIAEAIEAMADRPQSTEIEDAPSRAQQRLDALVAICETSLAGGHTSTRSRPRLIATIDISTLERRGLSEGARVLAAVAGRPQRLTPLATEMLACDAEIVPVWFDGDQPIAVGRSTAVVSARMRTALIARDGGCRFPGCRAPAAWSDAHHMAWRSRGGKTEITNLILLCRRHHRRVHRNDWAIRWSPGGIAGFSYRGRAFISHSRTRAPARE